MRPAGLMDGLRGGTVSGPDGVDPRPAGREGETVGGPGLGSGLVGRDQRGGTAAGTAARPAWWDQGYGQWGGTSETASVPGRRDGQRGSRRRHGQRGGTGRAERQHGQRGGTGGTASGAGPARLPAGWDGGTVGGAWRRHGQRGRTGGTASGTGGPGLVRLDQRAGRDQGHWSRSAPVGGVCRADGRVHILLLIQLILLQLLLLIQLLQLLLLLLQPLQLLLLVQPQWPRPAATTATAIPEAAAVCTAARAAATTAGTSARPPRSGRAHQR